MRSDIPKSDSETNKGPMIAIIVIVALFLLGYFAYMMFIPQQVENMNKTETIQPVEQTVKDSI
ncbi:MAG: hypothetical protein EOO18_09540 [Chryseobacterium sp.]|jgi:flagellar basal body-associated protein FliL|nr:MAG: hypothetical protein EOO18_09540 [Chryseobacterium sp.]